MLLLMFISFLVARKFKGKVFVLLMTTVLILVSLSSVGFPSVWGSMGGTTVWQVNLPTIPLSFPFYANISEVSYGIILIYPTPPRPPAYDVNLYLLGFQIGDFDFIVIASHIILLVSFFLLVNIVGAIFGYWISKTIFIERWFARRKPEGRTASV